MKSLFPNKIVLTIDFEDWFHSLDPFPENWRNYERRVDYGTNKLLEMLSLKNSKATFFVLGDAAVHYPQLIKRIDFAGHEIASHGFSHNFIYEQSAKEFKLDLRHSLDYLSGLTGKKIISYRAPYFSITNKSKWAFDILMEEGIEQDSSVFPVINHRYGISGNIRLPYMLSNGLWEWPITTYKTFLGNFPFAGGVYFRFLPVSVSKYFILSLLRKKEPVLFYIHPWELDPLQPRLPTATSFLRFRHYYGLAKTFNKLTSAFNCINIITLSEGIKLIKEK
jgi:polysaccharide deacetylase family protein (PEP-CTERM system associated)